MSDTGPSGPVPEQPPTPQARAWATLPWIWAVPGIALFIALWLGVQALAERGPTITISFGNAEGIEVGLEVAAVDLLEAGTGPMVFDVNSSPGLKGLEAATGRDLALPIVGRAEEPRDRFGVPVFRFANQHDANRSEVGSRDQPGTDALRVRSYRRCVLARALTHAGAEQCAAKPAQNPAAIDALVFSQVGESRLQAPPRPPLAVGAPHPAPERRNEGEAHAGNEQQGGAVAQDACSVGHRGASVGDRRGSTR